MDREPLLSGSKRVMMGPKIKFKAKTSSGWDWNPGM